MAENWKEIAWNGIRFETPAEWEPAQIGHRHLVLENEAGPVMEIKWGPVNGRFSHKVHLKRLADLHSRSVRGRIAEWLLPPHWKTALSDFETSGFSWQGDGAIGRGAILFCPVCRNAALIQFFRYGSKQREGVFSAVLKSYCDHRRDDRNVWSIFDIRALVPQKLTLTGFRFEAGKFELGFTDDRQKVYLHRWAPASSLLGGRDLVGFAGTIPEFSGGQPQAQHMNGCNAIDWGVMPESDWRRRLSRLKATPSFFRYRLWHLSEKNRILGIRAESKYPLDSQLLDQICADYESV